MAALNNRQAFEALCRRAEKMKCVVFAKAPFGGPEHVLKYLARYTHRVATAISRILSIEDESVETTQIFLDANPARKEDALKKTAPVNTSVGRFKPDDSVVVISAQPLTPATMPCDDQGHTRATAIRPPPARFTAGASAPAARQGYAFSSGFINDLDLSVFGTVAWLLFSAHSVSS
jgi:hypothetical protein